MIIGFQGIKNSYNDFATDKFIEMLDFAGAKKIPLTTSENVAKALINKEIDFGVVAGVQMLDEGVELNLSDDDESDDEFIRIRSKGFFNTIYQVRNSHFGLYIRKLMGDELFDLLNYQEYCIITLNYVIYVISKYEPKITTVKKQN